METNNKLREALEELMKFTCNSCEHRLCEDDVEEEDGQIVSNPCSAIIRARYALAKPPHNFEVGTPEEQYRRHGAFCDATRNGMSGYHCEDAPRCVFCFAKWAQMPYKKGETK